MVRRFDTFLFSLLVLTYSVTAFSQHRSHVSNEFVTDVINVRDGLISNYVTKTISDQSNLKYFATEGGISRYDGYSFKTYQPGDNYPQLLNENIEVLFKDNKNNIWIGTKSGGLSVLDISLDKITQFNDVFNLKTEAQLHVMSINQDGRGYIWVGTWNSGVYVIDYESKKVVDHYQFQTPILKIIRDRYDDMWFVAGFELLRYHESRRELSRFRLPYVMTTLTEDRYRNKLWIVGNSGNDVKLASMQLTDQKIHDEDLKLTAKYIRCITIDSKKRLWMGSWGDGLFISNDEVSKFEHVPVNSNGLTTDNINQSAILDIYIDKNEIAWLGTAYGGVLILYPNRGFELIANNSVETRDDNNAISIYTDPTGNLFVGTLTQGLLSRSKTANTFKPVESIPETKVNVVTQHETTLYVGTNKGLFVLSGTGNRKVVHRFPSEKITSIFIDKKENIWIGTQETGLKVTSLVTDPSIDKVKLYSESGKGRYYVENNRINKIIGDEEGTIWVATYSGLNKFDSITQSFTDHKSLIEKKLPTVIVNDFYIKGNTIYLGTPVGFIELTKGAGRLKINNIYDKRNGLVNDFICAFREDESGNIWMSSTTSIICFDPFKKSFVNYGRQDGVMINSFHIRSSFIDNKGVLYFGGSNGVMIFNPDSLKEGFKPPHVVFTGVIVNNKNLHVGDEVEGDVLLTRDINYTDLLYLGHKQNHLTLTFAANDFFGTSSIFYQYRRAGYDKEWIDIRDRNEISFTALSPGNYEVQVRASRDHQDWGEARVIQVRVDAPPWATWYAYLGYGIIILSVGFLINHVSTKQARLEAKLRIAEIEKEKEHDLNEAKITFFTNISHEFRTPLTLILSPVTEILSDLKIESGIREKVGLVEKNAKRLLDLINQLLDFRKSEHGLLKLNVTHADFISFANEVYLSFKEVARHKNITYKFCSEVDEALLLFDRDKMEIVICNLISNAFKYSRSGGEISLNICLKDQYLNLDVVDNGIGLSPEDATKVFDRFYQVQSSQTAKMIGSGIGLAFTKNIMELHHGNISVQSVPGTKTCFTVQLLLDNPYLHAQELSAKSSIDTPSDDYANELDRSWATTESLEINNSTRKETVLVVDDNEDIRKYISSLLREEYKVVEADNGVTALSIAKYEFPDIIVSDIMMPEMDGITFCQEIKSHIATSHIPVILLTARTSVVYEVSGLEMGADDYVTKPFNPVIMKTRIHNILENRKKLRDYFHNKIRFEPAEREVSEGNNIDEAFIERAIKLVNDNLGNDTFGVDVLVSELCMSQSTLYRKIKSLTGLSLTGFIRSIRLKKAAQLILSDNVKLSQVAFEVGFNDYKHFRTSFQQQFGCLPSDYKAEMIESIRKKENSI